MARTKFCHERLGGDGIPWVLRLYQAAVGHTGLPPASELQVALGLQKWSPGKFQLALRGNTDISTFDLRKLQWAIIEYCEKHGADFFPVEWYVEMRSHVIVIDKYDNPNAGGGGRPKHEGALSPFLITKIREWFHDHYKEAWEALQLPGQQGRPPVPEIIGYERFRRVIKDLEFCTPAQVLGIERGLMTYARANRTAEDCTYIAQNLSTRQGNSTSGMPGDQYSEERRAMFKRAHLAMVAKNPDMELPMGDKS